MPTFKICLAGLGEATGTGKGARLVAGETGCPDTPCPAGFLYLDRADQATIAKTSIPSRHPPDPTKANPGFACAVWMSISTKLGRGVGAGNGGRVGKGGARVTCVGGDGGVKVRGNVGAAVGTGGVGVAGIGVAGIGEGPGLVGVGDAAGFSR